MTDFFKSMKAALSIYYSVLLAVSSSAVFGAAVNAPRPNSDTTDENQQISFGPQQQLRLLETSEGVTEWLNPEFLVNDNKKFMDITDHPDLGDLAEATRARVSGIPNAALDSDHIKKALKHINVSRMKQRLEAFTGFKNRYYKSKTGVESALWLKTTIESLIEAHGIDASVTEFQHSWNQPSLIVRFNANDNGLGDAAPMVIVGSHQDTVKGGYFSEGRAPGADDDGSGSMTTLEAFTVLCETGFKPTVPVEFHWYSAEEMGLLGSQDIAHQYQREGKNVVSMFQFDMTGYGKKNVIGIINDYTDVKLTEYLRTLAKTYASIPIVETRCGYGCSDHASWNKAGYRSAFPFEGEFRDSSPYIHGKDDTVEHIDFDHMAEFVKLAVSYAMDMSSQSE
jgi:bacterial leucyl aminopeptidase